MSELSPTPTPTNTPTPTLTPTPTATPIPKKARIKFSDGYSTILTDDECCCPKSINIACSDLTEGKYYTVRLKNLTNTRSRIFPESIGFLAGSSEKNLEFFTQFECDEDKLVKLNTTYSLTTKNSSTKNIINPNTLNYTVTRIRSGTTELNTELFSIEKTRTEVILKLDDSIIPTLSKPIKFNILVTGSNIVTSHKQVLLNTTGDHFGDINVVNLDTPTTGIVVAKKTMKQTENGLAQPYSVTVPKGNGKDETATVAFQQNTKLYDNEGNQLTGDVNLVFAHFSNTSEESLEAFPGGFAINGAIDRFGDPIEENFFFYSAGFLTLEIMDESGKIASVSSNNFTIGAEVNGGTINYGSSDKRLVQPGDTVPIWSLGRDGIWKSEGEASLNSSLSLAFDTNHFTSWNWDWKVDACHYTSISIPQQITSQNPLPLWVSLYADPSRGVIGANAINARLPISNPGPVYDGIIIFTNYPDMPMTATIWKDRSATTKLMEVNINNCSAVSQPLPTPTTTTTPSLTPSITPTTTIFVTPSITSSSTPTPTVTITNTPSYTAAPAGNS